MKQDTDWSLIFGRKPEFSLDVSTEELVACRRSPLDSRHENFELTLLATSLFASQKKELVTIMAKLTYPLVPYPSFRGVNKFQPVLPVEANAIIARLESLVLKQELAHPPPTKKSRAGDWREPEGPPQPRPAKNSRVCRTKKPHRPSVQKQRAFTAPERVLALVAEYIIETEDRGFGRTLQALGSKSLCHFVRKTPCFWNNILLCSPKSFDVMLNEYLPRTGTSPLEIYVRFTGQGQDSVTEEVFFKTIAHHFSPHIGRIRTLTIRASQAANLYALLATFTIPELAVSLRTVDVALLHPNHLDPTLDAKAFFVEYPSRLYTQYFRRMICPAQNIMPHLRRLHLSYPEVYCNNGSIFDKLFQSYPNLRDLQIDDWLVPVTGFDWRDERELKAPCLETLKFCNSSARNVSILLDNIYAPNVVQLHVELDSPVWSHDPLPGHFIVVRAIRTMQQLSSTPAVEDLTLRYVHVPVPDVLRMLEDLPSLRSLTLEHCNVSWKTLVSLAPLPYPSVPMWVCPLLQTLRLSGCYCIDGASIQQLTRNRFLAYEMGQPVTPIRELVVAGCEGVEPRHLPFCKDMGGVTELSYQPEPLRV